MMLVFNFRLTVYKAWKIIIVREQMVNSINLVNSVEQAQKAESGMYTWEAEIKNRAGALIASPYKKSKCYL